MRRRHDGRARRSEIYKPVIESRVVLESQASSQSQGVRSLAPVVGWSPTAFIAPRGHPCPSVGRAALWAKAARYKDTVQRPGLCGTTPHRSWGTRGFRVRADHFLMAPNARAGVTGGCCWERSGSPSPLLRIRGVPPLPDRLRLSYLRARALGEFL
jgi:hypothetical protein